ncbi:MAG: hypothetical protein ACXWQO_04500 [Bdellovibrionota bacterium]
MSIQKKENCFGSIEIFQNFHELLSRITLNKFHMRIFSAGKPRADRLVKCLTQLNGYNSGKIFGEQACAIAPASAGLDGYVS